MEHEVRAEGDGEVARVRVRAGDVVVEGEVAAEPAPLATGDRRPAPPTGGAPPARRRRRRLVRADLLELRAREASSPTRAGPRRSPSATRSACAPRARTSPTSATPAASSSTARSPSPRSAAARALDDLIRNTPADGMVTGIGSINAAQFGAERSRCRRHGLRRHRARRHAGHAQPPEDRPHARHRAASRSCRWCCSPKAAAAGRATSTCPIVAGLHVTTFASFAALSRPGAGGRHRRRPLLRRQRRAARLLRRHHRHPRQHDRHGRPGDDRRRRPRRASRPRRSARASVQSRNGVIDVLVEDEAEAVAVARRYLVVSSRAASRTGSAPTRARCATLLPANRLRVYDVRAAIVEAIVDTGSAARAARRLRRRHRDRARAHRGPAGRPARQQPGAPRRRDRRRRGRQGRALHAAVRRARPADRLADRHARLHGRPRDRDAAARCAMSAGCSSSPRSCACRSSPSCCARATASARWRWPPAASMRRWPPSPGRAASSARWGSRARSSSASARSWTRRRRRRARRACASAGGGAVRQGQGDQHGGDAGDRRGHRSGRHAPLAGGDARSAAPAGEPGGRFIDPW